MADTAKARYDVLASRTRLQFLQRARHNALLSIPSLMPLEGHDGKSHLFEPYQGLGSRAVAHLASRVTMALLPAGRPYMRMDVSNQVKMETAGEVPAKTKKGLALSEQLIQSKVETLNWRDITKMTNEQLIVAGTTLEHMLPDGNLRVFRMDQFVVMRDHRGEVAEIILVEKFLKSTWPKEFGALPEDAGAVPATTLTGVKDEDEVEVYTWIKLNREGTYDIHQETAGGTRVGKSFTVAPADLDYYVADWSRTPGEDWGRSKMEEHIADFRSLEGLEKAGIELAAMGSKHWVAIKPSANAPGLKNRLTRVMNGGVVVANGDDIQAQQFEVRPGAQTVRAHADHIIENIARSFLLLSGAQRDAERVTAAEIERDIQELESALGGVFSSLSQGLMRWRTRRLMAKMKTANELPDFPEDTVEPVILTGLEALSRERDVSRAIQAGQLIQGFGPEAVDEVKLSQILGPGLLGLGFADAVRDEEEVAKIRNDRAQRQAVERAIGAAAPQLAKAATEGGSS